VESRFIKTDLEFLEELELIVKSISHHLHDILLELDDLGDKLLRNELSLQEFIKLDKIRSVLNQTKILMESLEEL